MISPNTIKAFGFATLCSSILLHANTIQMGTLFDSPHMTLSARLSDVTGATFTGHAEIVGKLLADGTIFNTDLEINAGSQPFSATQPDALIKKSTIKNNITATIRTIIFESSSSKNVTIKAIKDAWGNDLPCIVEIKGSTKLESLTFENGNGIVCLSQKAKAPKKLIGSKIIKPQELPQMMRQLEQQARRSDEETKKVHQEQLKQQIIADEAKHAELMQEVQIIVTALKEVIQKTFHNAELSWRDKEDLNNALLLIDKDGIRKVLNTEWHALDKHKKARQTLEHHQEIYLCLKQLLELDEQVHQINVRKKQSEEIVSAG